MPPSSRRPGGSDGICASLRLPSTWHAVALVPGGPPCCGCMRRLEGRYAQMRDPDLVQRAERAADALEQAWMDWRDRHGLVTSPLSPVSSYVGYSLEEPWGQPRVVLGIDATEAERLAAILEGHECVGPVYAGVTSRPERRLQASVPDSIAGWGLPDGRPGISLRQAQPAAAATAMVQPAAAAPAPAQPDATVHGAAGADATDDDQAGPAYPVPAPASSAADLAARDQGTSEFSEPAPPPADQADQEPDERPAKQPVQPPGPASRVPQPRGYPPAPIAPRARSNGQDRPSPAADQPAAKPDAPAQARQDQVTKTRLQPVSRLKRPRRSAPERPEGGETWKAVGDQAQAATDTAV
jgi:hypothetical protein